MNYDPQTWAVIVAIVLFVGGAVWQWGPRLRSMLKRAPEDPSPDEVCDIHAAVNAYNLLYDAVDEPAQTTLHDKIWPALARRPGK